MKNLLGKGRDTSYPPLNVNNKMVVDSETKASEFNNFFLSHSNIDLTKAQLPNEVNFPQMFHNISES